MESMVITTMKLLRKVLAQPVSWVIVVAVMAGMAAITIGLVNYSLFRFIIISDFFTNAAKFKIIVASATSFSVNFTWPEKIVFIVNALLAGLNVSVLVYYVKKRVALPKATGMGIFGVLGSFLGIGCTACGSVILVSLLGLSAAGNFIRLLPGQGIEFGLISILILLSTLLLMARKFKSPLACPK